MSFSQHDRHIIVLSGKEADCLNCAEKLVSNLNSLLLIDTKKANDYLGQEFEAVVFNSFTDTKSFDANAFGAISGTIRAGGFLLLLKPNQALEGSLFLEHFDQLLSKYSNVTLINPLNTSLTTLINKPSHFSQTPDSLLATDDQKIAVDGIINVVKGHRRRPLVLTADRGRGKSASLGFAAAQLINDGYNNIIICAPSKKSAAVIYQFISKNTDKTAPTFYSPDELYQKKPKADLVIIDEAAAIPIPLLTSFLKHYSRIVFSTTQHGYEGSGRGFSVNFHKILDSASPNWKSCKLKSPIRWNINDSLEAFVFEALLLNAEPVDESLISNAKLEHCQTVLINKQDLLKDDAQLKSLFGLLVSAHYQTKPSDLVQLLDDEAISIHTLQFNQRIIAVVLLIKEGEIEQSIAHDIFAGTRRLQGHLVAQSLAANVGIKNAPTLKGERISRIAVHPALQQQGFGSYLLSQLVNNSDADYLSTSFGATKPVINFWQKSGFEAVYLGMKRDASSGTHSVLMLHPKNTKGEELLNQAKRRFAKHFPHLLSEPFRELEANIALSLLSSYPSNENKLTPNEKQELEAFAYQQRGYENSIYPLWKLVCEKLAYAYLENNEKEVLLRKVLQKHSWQEVTGLISNLSGKKEALALLRKAITKLL